MSNLLDSFPMLTDSLIDRCGFRISEVSISYSIKNMERQLKLVHIEKKQYYLDDEYGMWTPEKNDLGINIKGTIQDKNVLFNNVDGVANKKTKLGIAVSYYCKKSNKNVSKPIASFLYEDDIKDLDFDIDLYFSSGELIEKIGIKIILYVVDAHSNDIYANSSGTVLGTFENLDIYIEGKGSMFPLKVVNDASKPLWYPEFCFEDIYEDEFNDKNVCLCLNEAHKNYKDLEVENATITPLLKEIIAEFIALFIENVKSIENIENVCEHEYDEEQAIGNVVRYWVKTSEMNINSFEDMLFSIKKMIDSLI